MLVLSLATAGFAADPPACPLPPLSVFPPPGTVIAADTPFVVEDLPRDADLVLKDAAGDEQPMEGSYGDSAWKVDNTDWRAPDRRAEQLRPGGYRLRPGPWTLILRQGGKDTTLGTYTAGTPADPPSWDGTVVVTPIPGEKAFDVAVDVDGPAMLVVSGKDPYGNGTWGYPVPVVGGHARIGNDGCWDLHPDIADGKVHVLSVHLVTPGGVRGARSGLPDVTVAVDADGLDAGPWRPAPDPHVALRRAADGDTVCWSAEGPVAGVDVLVGTDARAHLGPAEPCWHGTLAVGDVVSVRVTPEDGGAPATSAPFPVGAWTDLGAEPRTFGPTRKLGTDGKDLWGDDGRGLAVHGPDGWHPVDADDGLGLPHLLPDGVVWRTAGCHGVVVGTNRVAVPGDACVSAVAGGKPRVVTTPTAAFLLADDGTLTPTKLPRGANILLAGAQPDGTPWLIAADGLLGWDGTGWKAADQRTAPRDVAFEGLDVEHGPGAAPNAMLQFGGQWWVDQGDDGLSHPKDDPPVTDLALVPRDDADPTRIHGQTADGALWGEVGHHLVSVDPATGHRELGAVASRPVVGADGCAVTHDHDHVLAWDPATHRFAPVPDGGPARPDHVYCGGGRIAVTDDDRTLWIESAGAWSSVQLPDGAGSLLGVVVQADAVWVDAGLGHAWRYADGTFTPIPSPPRELEAAADGGVWGLGDGALVHVAADLTATSVALGDDVTTRTLVPDGDGAWVITQDRHALHVVAGKVATDLALGGDGYYDEVAGARPLVQDDVDGHVVALTDDGPTVVLPPEPPHPTPGTSVYNAAEGTRTFPDRDGTTWTATMDLLVRAPARARSRGRRPPSWSRACTTRRSPTST